MRICTRTRSSPTHLFFLNDALPFRLPKEEARLWQWRWRRRRRFWRGLRSERSLEPSWPCSLRAYSASKCSPPSELSKNQVCLQTLHLVSLPLSQRPPAGLAAVVRRSWSALRLLPIQVSARGGRELDVQGRDTASGKMATPLAPSGLDLDSMYLCFFSSLPPFLFSPYPPQCVN